MPENRQGQSWTTEEDNKLRDAFMLGASTPQLMTLHGRSRGGILARLKKNKLIDSQTAKPLVEIVPSEFFSHAAVKPYSSPKEPQVSLGVKQDQQSYLNWKTAALNIPDFHPATLFSQSLISVRVKNSLLDKGILDIRELFDLSRSQVLRIPNFGGKSFRELIALRDRYFTKNSDGVVESPHKDPSLQDLVETANTSLQDISAGAQSLQKDEDNASNLRELKHQIRKLRANLRTIERKLHAHEYGFDTEVTPDKVWAADEDTAQILISLVENIIEEAVNDERAVFILKARLGLAKNHACLTLEEIAQLYKISRERIRQIENKSNIRAARYISSVNHPSTAKLVEICKSAFQSRNSPTENEIVDFVQKFYGTELSQIDIAAYFSLSLKLSKSVKAARRNLNARMKESRKAALAKVKQDLKDDEALSQWANIFQHSLYPAATKVFDKAGLGFDQTLREPNPDSIGLIGSYFSEKCQRDISFESGEEFKTFQILEKSTKITWYREQPVEIPYESFGRSRRYYPDAIALTDQGRAVVVEVKQPSGMVLRSALVKALAAKDYLHEKGIGFLMVSAAGQSLQKLSKRSFDADIAGNLLSEINQQGEIYYKTYKSILGEDKFPSASLYSFIIQNDLAFQTHPFRLSKLPGHLTFAPLV